jgi:Pentapeptide repeats (8 copies)
MPSSAFVALPTPFLSSPFAALSTAVPMPICACASMPANGTTSHASAPTHVQSPLVAAAASAAGTATALALSLVLTVVPCFPAHAATSGITMRLPPIDRSNATRCTPASSAIGQANAARDSLLDLRECDLRNSKLAGFDLSGAILENATLDGADLTEAQLSKGYIKDASLKGANFTNAILDRTFWNGSDLSGAVFANAVLSDATFDGANLENTDWSDAYVSDFTLRAICRNSSMAGTNANGNNTRESLGCR